MNLDISGFESNLGSILNDRAVEKQLESAKKQISEHLGGALVEGALPLLSENPLVKKGVEKGVQFVGEKLEEPLKTLTDKLGELKSSAQESYDSLKGNIQEGLENLKSQATQRLENLTRSPQQGPEEFEMQEMQPFFSSTVENHADLVPEGAGDIAESTEASRSTSQLSEDTIRSLTQDQDLQQAGSEVAEVGSEVAEGAESAAGEVAETLGTAAAAAEEEPGIGTVVGALAGIGAAIAGAVELAEKPHHKPIIANPSFQFGV
jgi:uncharacterized membrane protein